MRIASRQAFGTVPKPLRAMGVLACKLAILENPGKNPLHKLDAHSEKGRGFAFRRDDHQALRDSGRRFPDYRVRVDQALPWVTMAVRAELGMAIPRDQPRWFYGRHAVPGRVVDSRFQKQSSFTADAMGIVKENLPEQQRGQPETDIGLQLHIGTCAVKIRVVENNLFTRLHPPFDYRIGTACGGLHSSYFFGALFLS